MTDLDRLREYALLLLLALLWGGSYPLIKLALESFTPLTLIAFRVSVAAVLLWAIALAQGLRPPSGLGIWSALLLQAVFNSIGAWTLLAWGQQHVDSGLAGVLNSTAPIFVFFLALALGLSTRFEPLKLAGALTGLAGVAALMGPEALSGLGTDLLAQAAILAGAILYACAALYGRRFSELPPIVTAAGTMSWATLALTPAAFWIEAPLSLALSASSVAAATALATLSTALALLIYFRLIRTIGSLGTASQAYLRSAIAVLLGAVFLGEPVTTGMLFGVGLVLVGMVLLNATPARMRRK